MRPRVDQKPSPQRRQLIVLVFTATAVLAATGAAWLSMPRSRIFRNAGRESLAVASIAAGRSTRIIVSTPNSNDCRAYQLNVATGERGDTALIDCNAENGKPGRLEAISRSFRNH